MDRKAILERRARSSGPRLGAVAQPVIEYLKDPNRFAPEPHH
jgi:hypothetical protein